MTVVAYDSFRTIDLGKYTAKSGAAHNRYFSVFNVFSCDSPHGYTFDFFVSSFKLDSMADQR